VLKHKEQLRMGGVVDELEQADDMRVVEVFESGCFAESGSCSSVLLVTEAGAPGRSTRSRLDGDELSGGMAAIKGDFLTTTASAKRAHLAVAV
jgi:hypothetical protein